MASGSADQDTSVDTITMLDVLNEEKAIEDETAGRVTNITNLQIPLIIPFPSNFQPSSEVLMRKTARTVVVPSSVRRYTLASRAFRRPRTISRRVAVFAWPAVMPATRTTNWWNCTPNGTSVVTVAPQKWGRNVPWKRKLWIIKRMITIR